MTVSVTISDDEFNLFILKQGLAETDYIIIKIAEAEALGDHAESERIRKEHADIIKQRAEYRKQINEIMEK